jgi:carotenoid cleavage dioxygenase-like enzyme
MSATAAQVDHRLGFRTLHDEVTVDDLPLEGAMPPWLAGSLLRTGPARFEVGPDRMRHWFDGLAMLHRFSIADGRVSYGNRALESQAYRRAEERGRIAMSEFATDPCRSLYRRVQSLFTGPDITDNGNVNVVRLGERFLAMTETPLPVQFDPATLHAAGVAYTAPGQLTTAHPHADDDGGMLNYAAKLGPRNSYRVFRVDPDGTSPRVIASLPVREPAYMHSFGLTERWFVLAEFPLVVNPIQLALSGRPYIENYRWKPELGTRFILVDRHTGEAVDGFRTEACFGFHHINAFERDGEVVVDVCTFEDARIIEDLYLERLRGGVAPISQAVPTRFRLSLGDRSVTRERLADCGMELPRINYRRCNGRPYRYAWGNDLGDGGWLEQIVRIDTETGESQHWSQPGCFPGEPVFVARPDGVGEDDGVLLSVVLDAAAESSFLLVLDAATLAPLARASVPHAIPFGFHGSFARGLTD